MSDNSSKDPRGGGRGSVEARRRQRFRPTLAALEDRVLLASYVVTNTNDGGVGSLRYEIGLANVDTSNDTITFNSTFNTAQTITLTSGALRLIKEIGNLTIQGPGANLLSISGNDASQDFMFYRGFYNNTATISGLTITGGHANEYPGTVVEKYEGGGFNNTDGTVTLNNCTISGNNAYVGGGVFSEGTTYLNGCTLSDNLSNIGSGGGLAVVLGNAILTDCTVSGNVANHFGSGAGVFNEQGTVTLTNCTVNGNSAGGNGGGVYGDQGTVTLNNCTVSGNSAGVNGGGVSSYRSTPTLNNTIVAGDTGGGDVYGPYSGSNDFVGGSPMLAPLGDYGGSTSTMPPLPGSPVIGKVPANTPGTPTTDQRGFARNTAVATDIGADQSGPLVVNTTADFGATGLLTLREAANLADVSSGNETITFSPAVFGTTDQTITLGGSQINLTKATGVTGSVTIQGPGANLLSINGNNASRVFALYSGATATLSGLTITGGSAGGTGTGGDGGGLFNDGGMATLTSCNVSGNAADFGGGLFDLNGTATLTNCTVSGNSAGLTGGGLENFEGTTTLTNCTVGANSAIDSGGGGLVDRNGTATLINCTVSGNTASGDGGGLENFDETVSLSDCTVFANSATTGGGLYDSGGTITLNNTIVAGDTSGGDVTGGYTGSNDFVGGNPLLAALGNYGGPTQTMPPLPGSPAIDAGSNALIPNGITTDQRGEPRIVNGKVDIGAVESQGYTLSPVAGSTPQTTLFGTAFANPLAITVTPRYASDPVNGGVITFAAPTSGASATLSAASAVVTGGKAVVTATANSAFGFYAVSASATGAPFSASFLLTNVGLIVTSFAPTSTGFTATFDEPFNLAPLNLYDTATAGFGPADVTLVGANTGPVTGSLVVAPGNRAITFVKTGGVLAADTYTVTFRSAANGLVDNSGNLLDGNADGTPGDNYVNTFAVAPTSARVLAVPDFARGPGQAVVIPAATGSGLPLTISDGSGVTNISLSLTYNPTLLSITGVNLGPNAPSGSSVSVNTSTPGVALLTFTSPTALPAGLDTYTTLVASVPNAAPYASKEALVIGSISLNGGAIPAVDQDGVHVVAYLGDTTGNGGYSSFDATLVRQVVANISTGFAAYPLLDPRIVGDIAGFGTLSGIDATYITQYVANIPQPRIPALPGVTIVAGGPDPLIWLPQDVTASPGSSLTVPVLFRQTNGTTIGLDSANIAIEFDPSIFVVTGVRLGGVTQGFTLTESYDNATGAIIASLRSPSGAVQLEPGTEGTLLLVDLAIRPGASLGAARLNLLGEGRVGSSVLYTSLNDGNLTLTPAPSDSDFDPTDGVVTVTAPAVSAPVWHTPAVAPAPALAPTVGAAGPPVVVDRAIEVSHGADIPAKSMLDDTSPSELIPWTPSDPSADPGEPVIAPGVKRAGAGRVLLGQATPGGVGSGR